MFHDKDRDPDMAGVFPFNSIGISYGVAVYQEMALEGGEEAYWHDGVSDPLHVEYAPSEEAAEHNARLWAEEHGYEVIE